MLVLAGTALFAQVDTTQTQQDKPAASKQSGPSNVYYGGTIGLSFGDYFRISVQPWVSVGVGVGF
jgi:hypothetical protein